MPAYGFDSNKNLIGVYSTDEAYSKNETYSKAESDAKIAPKTKLNTNAQNLQQLANKTYTLGVSILSALTSIKNGGTITDTQIESINTALNHIATVENEIIMNY